MDKKVIQGFDSEIYERGEELYRCGCAGEILRSGNRIFTSVSDDMVYNVILTVDGKELVDFYCDCSKFDRCCEHVCCAYIDFIGRKGKINDIKSVTERLSKLGEIELKELLEKSLMLYPSLLDKLNILRKSKSGSEIAGEMRNIFLSISDGYDSRRINDLMNLYVEEGESLEEEGKGEDACIIYATLLEILKSEVPAVEDGILSYLYKKVARLSNGSDYKRKKVEEYNMDRRVAFCK